KRSHEKERGKKDIRIKSGNTRGPWLEQAKVLQVFIVAHL
ncbi:11192_t:CDS:2, partial [Gigaspora rosea]